MLPLPLADAHAPPAKIATTTYCGIASSHHFTSTSPRDSDSGYSTSRRAGYSGSSVSENGG